MAYPLAPQTDQDSPPDGETTAGLSKDQIASTVRRYLDAAQNYSDQTLRPFREKSTEYYLGKPFGTEMAGRSQFIATEVRDTVQAMLPSIMRVFFGGERVVEFRPRGAEDVPQAEQASDYVNYLIVEENDGFLTLYAAFKDAMVRKIGIVKYWWKPETPQVEEYRLTGVSPDQLQQLSADPEIERITPVAQLPDGTQEVVVIRRTTATGRVCIAAVPPEELIFSPTARSLEDALLVAHVTQVRRSDLLLMGYDEDMVANAPAVSNDHAEEQARRLDGQQPPDGDDDRVEYAECYVYLDADGDGIAEHRKVCLIGNTVAADEPFTGRPFALFACDPEPHTMIGSCIADSTMDLQRAKSAVMRSTFDSLAQAVNPDTWIVRGQVEIADVMQNAEIGRVIRIGAPGMIGEFAHEFVGAKTIPLLGVLDEIKENRTGQSKAAMGLNPDALQSSTKAAVAATVSASQQHLELLARLFAEGMKQLFKGVLKLTVQYQDRPAFVRLRNNYVEIDPRPWNAGMDATVNVALGVGLTEEKLQQLGMIAAKQEQILAQMGPGNPLVTLGQYRETLARMVELAGFKDATRFFNPLPPNYQPPPEQPKPTPEDIYAQVEQMKVQSEVQIANERLELDRQKLLMSEDRERDNDAASTFLTATEMELKYGVQLDKNVIAEIVAAQRQAPAMPPRPQPMPPMPPPQPQPPEPPPLDAGAMQGGMDMGLMGGMPGG